ncbi:MAG: hypothetical protein ACP5OA_07220 [Candidatus Woesearchaeota archaeon]
MGLLDFLKKRGSDLPKLEPLPEQQLKTDLPPINMRSVDSSTLENLPTFDNGSQDESRKSLSVNVPTLDFSMPEPDMPDLPNLSNMPNLPNASNLPNLPNMPNMPSNIPNMPSGGLGEVSQAPNTEAVQNQDFQTDQNKLYMGVEDLNKLFINDDTWKEPDWKNFEPYVEEKIEEPLARDFESRDLPSFEEAVDQDASMASLPISSAQRAPQVNIYVDNSVVESDTPSSQEKTSPFNIIVDKPVAGSTDTFNEKSSDTFTEKFDDIFKERPENTVPSVELFIRSKSYNQVFAELGLINKTLSQMDERTKSFEEISKSEESLMISAKEQIEQVYKKLAQVDKKIFV